MFLLKIKLIIKFESKSRYLCFVLCGIMKLIEYRGGGIYELYSFSRRRI